jgi:small-conductance mechanosensitive channel
MVQGELWARIVVAAVLIAAFYLLSRLAKKLLNFLGHKLLAKTETVLDDRILEVILAHVKPLMVIIGFHVAVREVRKGATASELTVNQVLDYAESILYILVVLLIVKVLLTIVRVVIDWYLDRLSIEGVSDLKMTLGPLTSKVVNILVGMVAVIILLDHFGINIGSLLVSLGVGSLAVALAAQDTIANMIAGFVILVDRPFRVGDRIELATKEIGDVYAIGLRSTKILNFDNNVIIIPNAELVKSRIVNYSYPERPMKVQLNANVAYGTDPVNVRRILLDIAASHPDVLKEPAPEVYCTGMKDSAVEFTLMARTPDYARHFAVQTTLREQIYLALSKEGIEIPFPQQVVHVKAND